LNASFQFLLVVGGGNVFVTSGAGKVVINRGTIGYQISCSTRKRTCDNETKAKPTIRTYL
jgi:hypothetical protein